VWIFDSAVRFFRVWGATYLGFPHEPKFEHVRPTAALYVLVAGVERGVVELVFLEQILSARRVAFGQNAFVFGQKRRTLLRCCEHFVRVPRDRVGSDTRNNNNYHSSFNNIDGVFVYFYFILPVDAGQQVFMFFGHQSSASPSRINVQPYTVFMANVGDCRYRIERPQDCRTCNFQFVILKLVIPHCRESM